MSWGAALLGTRLCSSTQELREAVPWDLGGGFLTGDVVHSSLHFQSPILPWRLGLRAENSKLLTIVSSFC